MPPPVRRTRSHDRSLQSQSPPPPPPPPPGRQNSLSNEVGILPSAPHLHIQCTLLLRLPSPLHCLLPLPVHLFCPGLSSSFSPTRSSLSLSQVGIFWDYENVSLPRGVEEAAAAAQRLARLATTLGGRVVELRLYHDSEKPTLYKPHRAALERLGFTIIDCPTSDKKEASTLALAPIF